MLLFTWYIPNSYLRVYETDNMEMYLNSKLS